MQKYSTVKPPLTKKLFNCLNNLRIFETQIALQKAVLSYIASHELTAKDERELQEIFDYIDENKNGSICKDNLARFYELIHEDKKEAEHEAEKTMKMVDMNNNGTIDYNEFLMANLTTMNGLKNDILKKAFDFFDAVISY